MRGLLIFDMDGVLVDVTDSYRETIIRTIAHFTGRTVTRGFIQQIKNRGGYNDDFALSFRVIRDFGFHPRYPDVIDHFQRLFLGENSDGLGLIQRERWTARDGLFERLSSDYRLAIFTGRTREEARLTLDRFAPHIAFDPIIGNKEVDNHKPAPDGILKVRAAFPGAPALYVGDNIDDLRSARAAQVPFIGIASPGDELVPLFLAEGARSVIDDINHLESAL